MIKLLLLLTAFLPLAGHLLAAELSADYEEAKATAERLFSEGSYSLAHAAYGKLKIDDLPISERRWVEFRLADTQWRSQGATQTADTTKFDEAKHQLEVLIRDISKVEDQDRVWAEVHESLGDLAWTRRNQQNWGEAWPNYEKALDWWAGAADVELARQRYLKIVWRLARPPEAEPYYYYGYYGNYVPLQVIQNALEIARTDEEKAHAHYLIAMTLRTQAGDAELRATVPEEFEAAIKMGKKTEWYDDALYNYAEWMTSSGRFIPLKEGGWQQQPDYPKALELFRRFVNEFREGESRYWQQARQQIKNITDPQLSLSVPNIFLPDSEIQYYLSWRNLKRIELSIYPVQLNQDVALREQNAWLSSIDVSRLEKVQSWSRDARDAGDFKPGSETVRLESKIKPGAYIFEAKGGGQTARELLLISDATLVLKSSGKQALLFFCNALTGEPLSGAKFRLWERWHDGQHTQVRATDKISNGDGIAVFDLTQAVNNFVELFASAIVKDRQAFTVGNGYGYNQHQDSWKIYAFCDRPAYRPQETVQWKIIARKYDGSVYSTPSGQTIEFEVHDPRGAKIKEEKLTLNPFGTACGAIEVTEKMPLGEYRVTFYDSGKKISIGNATLFRLEEYKLPEFKVTVQTPEENGQKKTFRVGDKITANIQADYYFGGPVVSGNVEVLVYQTPFYHYWHPVRDYPWFYEDVEEGRGWNRSFGGGQIIKRETVKTDASGRASITFDTPRNAGQDFEYRIEARVTDASRREIVGNGKIRVTRQRYYAYVQPVHNLYRPQDKVSVDFKLLDANDHPVSVEGTVKVTRDYWFEIWLDSGGKEVKGEELRRVKAAEAIFPPPPKPNQPGWTLKFRGYEHSDILSRSIKADTNGMAQLSFTPEREGYYRISWTSEDRSVLPNKLAITNIITADSTVWVATTASTELGYRHGGMEIIVDKDTFRVGEKAPVMLVVPTNDRYVLFTTEGEDLYSYKLVHMQGTVKLIELDIEEKHVPNIFLGAAFVSDRQMFVDSKQVIVPPTKNFISVDVKPDRPEYQPRDEGTFTITTLDHNKKPISAEVALSVVDESLFYIQQDYAGDPRQFYFGNKRPQYVQTQSTMNQKAYARLVRGPQDQLIDERDLARTDRGNRSENELYSYFSKDGDFEFRDGKKIEQLADRSEVGGFGGATRNRMQARGLAVNAPAPSLLAAASESKAKSGAFDALGAEPIEAAVQVRSDFRSTVLWQPTLTTDKAGKVVVKLKYPDSLTGWKATARVVSEGNQFGISDATTRTRQPLIVRLQAPRFFVVGDTLTISAVANNNTDKARDVKLDLEIAGGVEVSGRKTATVKVGGNLEGRADWVVHVTKPGEVKLKVTGRADALTDSMEKAYTAYEHGIEKFISRSGKMRHNEFTTSLVLPAERKPNSTSFSVQITPSLAVTMLDALPYLIDYPYGCTEQTMSRFLPAVITVKTLKDQGLRPEEIMGRLFGGIEENSASSTHPDGKRDLTKLNTIIKESLERLYDFQRPDGGWAWWKEGDSDHWMTAYVVWGLALARQSEVTVKAHVLERAVAFLDKKIVEEEQNPEMQAFILHALANHERLAKRGTMSEFQKKAFDNLWVNRDKLNAYTRALLALAAHDFGKNQEAGILVQNLENGVKRDNRPDTSVLLSNLPAVSNQEASSVIGTAHWGEDGIYWRWSEGGVEATAFALRALLAIDPQNKLIEPVTNWLIKNRRGAQWNSTRATAIAILSLNDYLRSSGELKNGVEFELMVNGTSIAKKKVGREQLLSAPSRFVIEPRLIGETNVVQIRQTGGKAPLYFALEAKFFSLEEPIAAAGNEIFVKREYFKLVGRRTLLKGYVYEREPLRNGGTVASGERVETVLTIEGKNNYEYLIFEDLKPAGFEAVQIRSGESLYARELKLGAVERKFSANSQSPANDVNTAQVKSGAAPATLGRRSILPPNRLPPTAHSESNFTERSRYVYQELRDRKVAMFVDKLPEGVWEIRYDFRAEVPGEFHALPVTGYAMYVPEIHANSDELRVSITEASH